MYSAEMRWVDIDGSDIEKGLAIGHSNGPLLEPGNPGTFDDHGTMGGSILEINGETYLYYSGWSLGGTVPYSWGIGVARLNSESGKFKRIYEGPIIGSSKHEPFLQASPIVFPIAGGFRMLYLSGYKWIQSGGRWESLYHLCSAESSDGLNWVRTGTPIIPKKFEEECQTSPTVLSLEEGFVMLFSYRDGAGFREPGPKSYRIGAAWSTDLKSWERLTDPTSLAPSPDAWDSEMVCYPHCFSIGGKIFLLYCGNSFGVEGFGLAVLDEYGPDAVLPVA